ncbi:cysteine-rich CWC family protein [Acidovorax sp. sif1233]|uniref:cysteine-rich CWC family protein n=1 Tax=Acidovorax sp. sif1233 TaxID=2854792 RepID=UPI001C453567|nr:cysteine-rich CWC family protein [Acidovorax sp. sif1233]MBV7456586.1 cysteine-rich CWC family protein [Acidovorax sp. sif1233]
MPPSSAPPSAAPSSSPSSSCPLCGQPNQCAIAAGQPAESCWCMARVINPEALAALPAPARGQVCICPACGARGAPAAPRPGASEDAPAPI